MPVLPRFDTLGLSFFAIFFVICCYGVWAGNIAPLIAAKNTNYGYAYASIDAKIAEGYFEKAISEPLNFDLSETANKYQEFATDLLRNPRDNSPKFVQEVAERSISTLEEQINQNPNNPISWEKLAALYLNYAYASKGVLDQRLDNAVDKAISLAPKRTEAMSLKLQLAMLRGDYQSALQLGRQIEEINPSLDNLWQLSIALEQSKNIEEAIQISEKLLDKDYSFPNLQSLDWLKQYYIQAKNWPRAEQVVEKMIKLQPDNKDLYISLVDLYSQSGKKQQATNLAIKLLELDANLKPKLLPYLPTLNTDASK